MHFATLSPTKGSGDKLEPNLKKISNAFIKKATDETVKLQVPAEYFEYPQVDGDDITTLTQDYLQFCGGDFKVAKDFLNAAIEDASVSAGLTKIRTATTSADGEAGGYKDIINLGLQTTKDWTPKAAERISAKEVGNQLLALKAEAANLSPEELQAKVLAMLGL